MDKIIVMVRTSTSEQDIAGQHKEMEDYVISKGWRSEQIVWVEEQGASAAKVDGTYRSMIDTIKEKVESDRDIKCFAVWHLNRLARTEEVWVEVKTFFVSHKVQVLVKNPELRLLTEDGKVDAGMELAAGLLAILSVQDQLERKEKFKRAKKAMAASGKYVGGHIIPYGYRVGDGGFFEENKEEADAIRLAFQLYSTGNYSTYTLSKELEERGIYLKDVKLCRMLRSRAYLGEPVGEYKTRFPAIISQELFDAVEKVRGNNRIDMKKKGIVLGAKLIKCFKCGAVCTSNSRHYVCSRHSHHGNCDNGFALRQSVANSLLWRVAEILQIEYLTNLNADKEKEFREEIAMIEKKIAVVDEKLKKEEVKRNRIVESYMDGLIDRNTRDLRLSKVQDDIGVQLKQKSSLQGKRDAIAGMLEGIDKDMDLVEAVADAAVLEYTEQEKFDIVHRFILSLTARQVSYGERDKRSKNPNGVEIDITCFNGVVHRFMYFPRYYKGSNLYVWNGRRYVADRLD